MQRKSVKLEVLIAAQNMSSKDQLPPVVGQVVSENCAAVLINQSKSEASFESPSPKLRIFHYPESGISRSRNRALQHAGGDLLLITDDDVELLDGFSEIITDAFDKNPEADIITFQCLNEHGEKRKNYSDSPFLHNLRTLMRVSSVEIVMRRESLDRKPLLFDARFGIGSQIPTGCETVFLSDAHRKGFKILYIPTPIVMHPDESSGRTLYLNAIMVKAKGGMFSRIFGWKAYGICILFALKKRKEIGFSLTKSIGLMFKGIKEFKALDHGK